MYEAVCAAKLIWIQQFWREGYYTANLASINTSLSNMFEQWRYHFLLRCRCWHSLPLLPDRLELPSNCFLPFAYCMSSILNDLPFVSETKMLLPSDQFHQPRSGWPWWSMMLHQLEKQNELLFFNLGPFQDFFIRRCTTTQQISADMLSELSFSCHLRSPAGNSGGSAAINDFFCHLDEGADEFMLLTELTNVSPRALVASAY